ncbi:hypothetical protein GGS24DRAFT_515289 [Hypoxylon argillaceum]|nr:hypothetical protein GGS24DRAFT_515289 [Hypoxylon argillaceum]
MDIPEAGQIDPILLQILQNSNGIYTSRIPPAYAPSVRLVDDLISIPISQMELQRHYRGKKVILRVMTPQIAMASNLAIVEDEDGTAVLLQLCNQQSRTTTDVEDLLRPNMVLIVKEPFLEFTGFGEHSIRLDHISDVVWLKNTDPRIPLKWKDQGSKTETSAVIREHGNAAVQKKQWAKAERLYSEALRAAKTPEEGELVFLNRSLVNLRLQRPEKALEDALSATKGGRLAEKGLLREARALYELGKFTESVDKWRMLVQSYPLNAGARAQLRRSEKRVKEARTGEYDFASMYEQAKETPPIIDCATYREPVAIRKTQDRGNGLFTTKPVKAGDLLLCEKAFAYCYADLDDPIGRRNTAFLLQSETGQIQRGGQAYLRTDIIQKLYHSPQAAKDFKALYHGDYTPLTVSEVDGQPVVDTFFVDKVTHLNSFAAPRTNYILYKASVDQNEIAEEMPTCGIWTLASRINHSCMENCRRSFIGDMQIVRACQDLAAGTELSFPYPDFTPRDSYEETQKKLGTWGFVCDCELCLDRKSTTKQMISTRGDLMVDLRAAMAKVMVKAPDSSVVNSILLTKLPGLVRQIEATYPKRQGAVKLEVMHGWFSIGQRLVSLHRPREGAAAIIKGLEAYGYDVVACPPQSGGGKRLEIRRWGCSEDSVVRAFMFLQRAYMAIAPELCVQANRYARIAFSICTGTDVNIGDVHPLLGGPSSFVEMMSRFGF